MYHIPVTLMLADAKHRTGTLGNVYHIPVTLMLAHAKHRTGTLGNVYHIPVTLMLAHAKHRTGTLGNVYHIPVYINVSIMLSIGRGHSVMYITYRYMSPSYVISSC